GGAGGYDVAADPHGRQLDAETARQVNAGGLGGGVAADPLTGYRRGVGGDSDDAAAAAVDHRPGDGLRQQKDAGGVGGEHRRPVGDVGVQQRRRSQRPGGVHQYIDVAQLGFDSGHRG